MTAVPILFSFARSGGTLVNQLLGVHPACLVLSEVNPAASFKPVAEQAWQWLDLVDAQEAGDFARLGYREQITRLAERARARGKQLVVRDWVTVNFLDRTADAAAPSGQLEQLLYLQRGGLEAVPVVVTRRAAGVYRSIVRNFGQMRDMAVETFAHAYLAYARAVSRFPRVHLERLRAAPEAGVGELLERFRLDAAPAAALLRDFHEFRRCTGNTTLEGLGGSADARQVLPPEPVAPLSCPELDEADRLLGYEG
jgi:hypothetical protein